MGRFAANNKRIDLLAGIFRWLFGFGLWLFFFRLKNENVNKPFGLKVSHRP